MIKNSVEDRWMGELLFGHKPIIKKRLTAEDVCNILESKSPMFKILKEEFGLDIVQ